MSYIILLYCVKKLIVHSGFAANSEKSTKSVDTILIIIYLIDIALDLLVRLQIIREWIDVYNVCHITLRRRAEEGD